MGDSDEYHAMDENIAAEYDEWSNQYESKYDANAEAKTNNPTTTTSEDKWVRPTSQAPSEALSTDRRQPPPEPPEPSPPLPEVNFYIPRGNPIETLRSSAEIAVAMVNYIDNLSVQEGSCREIIRLCKVNAATFVEREHAYSQQAIGAANPTDIKDSRIAANRPLDTKLSADEAVQLHLVGNILTAMTRFWSEPIFCGFAFEAIAVMARNKRAQRISVPAESHRHLKQLGTGFDAFIGAMDAHHLNATCMARACEAIGLLSEGLPTNRNYMIKAGAPQAVTNALNSNPTSA